MNSILLLFLLFCTLSVVKCCRSNDGCNYLHCQFGGHCVHGHHSHSHCECAKCRHDADCPSCDDHGQTPHRYCSVYDMDCHCVECLENNHCNCPQGKIGICGHDHQTRHHCTCQDPASTITTTQQPLVKLECSHQKISVIESIAENLHVEDSRAAPCPGTTKHQTSEALVINKCNSTARNSWSKGEQVKSVCSNNAISQYTPISTFLDHGNDMAAFFIECTTTADGVIAGLTVAAQTCHDAPMVMKLNDTTNPKMSDFYTILQRK